MASAAQLTRAPLAINADGGICDLSKGTYFKGVVSGNMTFQITAAPADVTVFDVEINHVAGTAIGWPANVRWAGGIAPYGFVNGKVHLFSFRRIQSIEGSEQWIGMFQLNC